MGWLHYKMRRLAASTMGWLHYKMRRLAASYAAQFDWRSLSNAKAAASC